ncbi:MAG: hypothetical protein ACR2H1_00080, partial [Limisphaerales bacterium]
MKLPKKIIVFIAATFALLNLNAVTKPDASVKTAPPAKSADSSFPDKIIAKGKEFEVKQNELDDA